MKVRTNCHWEKHYQVPLPHFQREQTHGNVPLFNNELSMPVVLGGGGLGDNCHRPLPTLQKIHVVACRKIHVYYNVWHQMDASTYISSGKGLFLTLGVVGFGGKAKKIGPYVGSWNVNTELTTPGWQTRVWYSSPTRVAGSQCPCCHGLCERTQCG